MLSVQGKIRGKTIKKVVESRSVYPMRYNLLTNPKDLLSNHVDRGFLSVAIIMP